MRGSGYCSAIAPSAVHAMMQGVRYTMSEPSVAIRLRGLTRRFGDVVAVDGVDLDVLDGEFLTLLGPSGSGKTTVLRMIAGFERPDDGTI